MIIAKGHSNMGDESGSEILAHQRWYNGIIYL
jgi:hypothetical protein